MADGPVRHSTKRHLSDNDSSWCQWLTAQCCKICHSTKKKKKNPPAFAWQCQHLFMPHGSMLPNAPLYTSSVKTADVCFIRQHLSMAQIRCEICHSTRAPARPPAQTQTPPPPHTHTHTHTECNRRGKTEDSRGHEASHHHNWQPCQLSSFNFL